MKIMVLAIAFIAMISAFAAHVALAGDDCGTNADIELRRIYGLPDEADANVCRHYGVLLMKSMLTDAGPFVSRSQQAEYEKKAHQTSKRAVRKCTAKKKMLVRECRALAKAGDD